MSKNKAGNSWYLQRQYFLGTSIVPLNEARKEQEAKAAQVIANYTAKRDEARSAMKKAKSDYKTLKFAFDDPKSYKGPEITEDAYNKYVEAKRVYESIRKPVIELQLAFIPFKGAKHTMITQRKRSKEVQELLQELLDAHGRTVTKELDRLDDEYYKKYGTHTPRAFVTTVDKYRKTSKKQTA